MINRSLGDMIVGNYGEERWDAVKREAGVDIDVFVGVETYPDEITYALVGSAAKVLGLPLDDLLRMFGVHWITDTAETHYGGLMQDAGNSLGEFLRNLPHFHQRVSLLFPHLDPPDFYCTDVTERSLRLHYVSLRPGLTHFVEGLLIGLGKRFRTPIAIRIAETKSSGMDHDEFVVSW